AGLARRELLRSKGITLLRHFHSDGRCTSWQHHRRRQECGERTPWKFQLLDHGQTPITAAEFLIVDRRAGKLDRSADTNKVVACPLPTRRAPKLKQAAARRHDVAGH